MPGLLEGPLAKAIYNGFKGKLLTGVLRRETLGTTLNSYGDPTGATVTTYAIEGFTSRYSDFYRATAGIPETDIKVNIFAQSSPGLTPTKDDLVQFQGIWYQLRSVSVDPATALYSCQAFVTDAPT
jgi:hypothetical protein